MARKKTQAGAPLLRWVPAKGLKRTYELRTSEEEVIGSIRWPRLFGSLAEGEYRSHKWTFKRGGFLRPHVTVRQPASETDLAVLSLAWGGGGMVRLSDGSQLRWERVGFWGRRFAFADLDGNELIGFEPSFGLVRRSCAIETRGKIERSADFGLLVTLGWYVILLITDDEASSAAVICCM